jgi:hypothetical protein
MSARHQRGYLRCRKRKNGNSSWEFMWRTKDSSGKRVRRTAVIGTIDDYPTQELAQAVVNSLPPTTRPPCDSTPSAG